nr:unnamed protein product [Callosobruchus analis]
MALKCQITHFIEEHDILTSAQSGFRAQHSTTTALLSNNRSSHNYTTRSKNNLKTVQPKFTYIQRNVQYSTIKIWNKLPENVRMLLN